MRMIVFRCKADDREFLEAANKEGRHQLTLQPRNRRQRRGEATPAFPLGAAGLSIARAPLSAGATTAHPLLNSLQEFLARLVRFHTLKLPAQV